MPHPWPPPFWNTVDRLLGHEPDLNARVYFVGTVPRQG